MLNTKNNIMFLEKKSPCSTQDGPQSQKNFTWQKIALPETYQPSQQEVFMNDFQKAYFARKLLILKQEVLERIYVYHTHYTETTNQEADSYISWMNYNSFCQGQHLIQKDYSILKEIEKAWIKLEHHTYGYCEDTGEPISLQRLEIMPYASVTLEAKEWREQTKIQFDEDQDISFNEMTVLKHHRV
jgi:DnaK suppressor protein